MTHGVAAEWFYTGTGEVLMGIRSVEGFYRV